MPIQPINTIKKWFKTGLKPSQDQFWDTWDSFRHKYEQVPIKDIEDLEATLNTKAEKSQLDAHKTDVNAHSLLFAKKEDKINKGVANGYVPLDEVAKIASQYLNIINDLVSGGVTSLLSAEQGVVIQNQIDLINNLLKSDNVNLNTIQKIVDTIKEIQLSLNSILVNDLTTGGVTKALTAEMGKILQSNKEDKSQKGISGGYAPLNDFTKLASQYLDIVNDLVSGGTNSLLSAEQGKVLQNQINGIHTLLQSDNVNLDTLQEIVDTIEEVQMSLSTILVNDLTTGGTTKALTAEMGKLLQNNKVEKLAGKSLISDSEINRLAGVSNAVIATDTETQISSAITEDNKIVSRSKLFNWWDWIKRQSQTITAIWNFKQGISVNNSTGNYIFTTQMLEDKFISYLTSAGLGNYRTEFTWESIKWFMPNGYWTGIYPSSSVTQNNTLKWPNKSGTVAITNDFVTTAPGTSNMPALIIPNGSLTTTQQNGAIERDSSGQLWETHNGLRSRLITTADGLITVPFKTSGIFSTNITGAISDTNETSYNITAGSINNSSVMRLNAINEIYFVNVNPLTGIIAPTIAKSEIYLKLNNGLFCSNHSGANPLSQVKIMEFSGLNNNGFKNYMYPLLTSVQNPNILLAQWSTIQLFVQVVSDGIMTASDVTYYLRDIANTRSFGASEAQFSFIIKNIVTYTDPENINSQNLSKIIRLNSHALYLETIR